MPTHASRHWAGGLLVALVLVGMLPAGRASAAYDGTQDGILLFVVFPAIFAASVGVEVHALRSAIEEEPMKPGWAYTGLGLATAGASYFLYQDVFSHHARRWNDDVRGVALFTGMVASQYIGFAVPALAEDGRSNMRAYGISWLLGPPATVLTYVIGQAGRRRELRRSMEAFVIALGASQVVAAALALGFADERYRGALGAALAMGTVLAAYGTYSRYWRVWDIPVALVPVLQARATHAEYGLAVRGTF